MENSKEIQDRTGAKGLLKHCQNIGIGPTELMAFFFRHMSELLYDGHGSSWIGFHNKCRAIYIEMDGKIVGHIIYDYIVDQKRTWINLSAVDPAYRKRGLYSIMHEEFEIVSKKLGAIEISSFVHVDNIGRLKSAEQNGFLPRFLRMGKIISNK
jgi:hypothetical protein